MALQMHSITTYNILGYSSYQLSIHFCLKYLSPHEQNLPFSAMPPELGQFHCSTVRVLRETLDCLDYWGLKEKLLITLKN